MNTKHKKAVIFAPFWGHVGHVGNLRVDRFMRWLIEDGYSVAIIRAGSAEGERQVTWGTEITVRDNLGLYRDNVTGSSNVYTRKPNKLRRWLAYWLFNPDPTVVWAKAAAKNERVLAAMQRADFILSSSPPESAHVGAWQLSRRTGVPHIVDMRDGWLDEPLKPLLRSSLLRRWQEGRIEGQILSHAKAIQVTSTVWKDLLCDRHPKFTAKVQVLTNGYPQQNYQSESSFSKNTNKEKLLIHAGRFSGSDTRRTPNLLLAPLLRNFQKQASSGVIELIGPLSTDELRIIEPFKSRFNNIGWRIECPGNRPRNELLERLQHADGLLLLSASYAALPSKLFEYIPTGKPIFAVTEHDSATWKICEKLPQATLIDVYSQNQSPADTKDAFYSHTKYAMPEDYSEAFLKLRFKEVLTWL
jgi:hypothetical protein